jgi:hypothetical protein
MKCSPGFQHFALKFNLYHYNVVSGGLDCAVVKWDYSRTSPVARWSVTELAAAEAAVGLCTLE